MLPNLISLSRLLMAAAFVRWSTNPLAAVAILCMAGISDWLDGWVAKRLGQETPFGALLDPVCDRLFVVPVLATLVVVHGLPLWELGVMIARDVVNSLGALALLIHRPERLAALSPRRSGKIVTSLQFWAVVHVVLHLPLFGITLAALAAANLWAVVDYGARFRLLVGASKSVSTP
jgi:CDP-diacylglycerol--glycerol-3-phosphate 3-phosphatidyltransferase